MKAREAIVSLIGIGTALSGCYLATVKPWGLWWIPPALILALAGCGLLVFAASESQDTSERRTPE